MPKKLIFVCIALFLGKNSVYSENISSKVNELLHFNDLQGLEELAESYGGWPGLLKAYPELLYDALYNYNSDYYHDSSNRKIEPDTFSFLLDKGADQLPYPKKKEGSYLLLALKQASRDRRLENAAERLIGPEPDISITDSSGRDYLYYVCSENFSFSLSLAEQLIARGADVNVSYGSEKTPLLLAVSSDQTELTALLLRHGADLDNLMNSSTIFYKAAENGNKEILKMLLDRGVDLNSRYYHGPLLYAILKDVELTEETFTLLMEYRPDLQLPDDKGNTVLHYALGGPNKDSLIPHLMGYDPPVDTANEDGVRPIHLAARFCSAQTVELLLRAGADLNARTNKYGETPLFLAAKDGSLQTVKLLLQAGADPNTRTCTGETPLERALYYDRDLSFLQELIDGGSGVNERDHNGEPYLFNIVGHSVNINRKQALFLLENGADPRKLSASGRNILFPYAEKGSSVVWEIFPFVEEYVNSKDNDGYTPLHIAFSSEEYDFAYDLIQRGADYLAAAEDTGERPVDAFLNRKSAMRAMREEAPILHTFFLGTEDFGAEYQAKIDFYAQEDREASRQQKKDRLRTKLMVLGLPLLWLGGSYLARTQLEQNPMGVINGVLFLGAVGVAGIGWIGYRAGEERYSSGYDMGLGVAISTIIGAGIGLIGGVAGGIVLRDQFESHPWLYYAAPALASLGGLTFVIAY